MNGMEVPKKIHEVAPESLDMPAMIAERLIEEFSGRFSEATLKIPLAGARKVSTDRLEERLIAAKDLYWDDDDPYNIEGLMALAAALAYKDKTEEIGLDTLKQ